MTDTKKTALQYTAAQLLALAAIAHEADDRPHIRQVRWTPHYIAATNGHRMVIATLPHDKDRDFGIDSSQLKRWLSGARGSDLYAVRLTSEKKKSEQRVVIMRLNDSNGTPTNEGLLLPPVFDSPPPFRDIFPKEIWRGEKPTRTDFAHAPPILPHAISGRYLEGIGALAAAFGDDGTGETSGFELVWHNDKLGPIFFHRPIDDGEEMWLVQMPVRRP